MSHPHARDPQRCREVLGQLNDYVDGALAAGLCRELEQHLAGCPNCQVVVDTLRQTIALYHALDPQPIALPAGVEARLLGRLQALREQ